MSRRAADEDELFRQIVQVCYQLAARGMVAATDGNVSARLSTRTILITRSGVHKGEIVPGDVLKVDLAGRRKVGTGRPSTEAGMHLFVYRHRPDVKAIVHAHPVCATGFAAARIPLDHTVLPEVAVTLGPIPLAPYATPSTTEVADSLKPCITDANAILLANHGVVTFGSSLREAWYRMEKVEHAAAVLLAARTLGGAHRLTPDELDRLAAISQKSYGKEIRR